MRGPLDGLVEIVRGEEQLAEERSPEDKKAYLIKLARKPIWLDTVEFRIFVYLAEKPYKAYSREQLARAVHRVSSSSVIPSGSRRISFMVTSSVS